MKNRIFYLPILLLTALYFIPALPAGAQIVTSKTIRASDRQIRMLMTRIESKTDAFRTDITGAVDQSAINTTNRDDRIQNLLDQFEASTQALRRDYYSGRDLSTEVNDVLTRAAAIDGFMSRNQVALRAQNEWSSLKTDLNTLASYYNVSWNWNANRDTYGGNYGGYNGAYNGGNGRGNFDSRITGTYRLNTSQSDDINNVLGRSYGSYSVNQPDDNRRNLERRLTSPEMIAIEKVGSRVSLASSLRPQVTFDADGIAKSEVGVNGRTVSTTVSADRNALSIRYQGERANDFFLTFEPMANGQLRVTRRISLDNTNQTVNVTSVYDKIDSTARWSMVNSGTNTAGYNNGGFDNSFIIPNATRLTAVLENNVSTRASQTGDRFTMRVTSPYQYSGAIIEGHVASASASGRLSGRATMSLELDSIRMPNGQSYRFAGMVESVRPLNGDSVSINNEGTVRDTNQTTKAVTRAGVGAVIGAIIGAVAGGGQGAAIGATVGAGAGAGSVLIQGRDNIELGPGSEFVITASAPPGVGQIR